MFRCRDLLALPTMTRAKLIAGECGLDREIRWSYKAEGMDFADWVHGRELLIVSSPVIHSADFDMKHLVEEAIRRNLSGILLLVGKIIPVADIFDRMRKNNLMERIIDYINPFL